MSLSELDAPPHRCPSPAGRATVPNCPICFHDPDCDASISLTGRRQLARIDRELFNVLPQLADRLKRRWEWYNARRGDSDSGNRRISPRTD